MVLRLSLWLEGGGAVGTETPGMAEGVCAWLLLCSDVGVDALAGLPGLGEGEKELPMPVARCETRNMPLGTGVVYVARRPEVSTSLETLMGGERVSRTWRKVGGAGI